MTIAECNPELYFLYHENGYVHPGDYDDYFGRSSELSTKSFYQEKSKKDTVPISNAKASGSLAGAIKGIIP